MLITSNKQPYVCVIILAISTQLNSHLEAKMHKESVFFRKEALGTKKLHLPGNVYNAIRRILAIDNKSRIFVPVKALSSVAVISSDEILFVDRYMKKMVEFSWQEFKPQARTVINEPVEYEVTWHNARSLSLLESAPEELAEAIADYITRSKKHLLRHGQLIQLDIVK